MHIFYAPGLTGNQFPLNEEESLHLSRVLRLKLGETVRLLDGVGGMFEGEIQLVHQKNSVVGNLRPVEIQNQRPYYLHIAIAPTKMMERFEWFLEKATEIGIDEITPIITARTERTILKMPRMEKLVQAAMKQSMNAFHPKINEAVSLSEFLKKELSDSGFIAHCIPEEKSLLVNSLEHSTNLSILIGPEGDFTAEEVKKALTSGYMPVSLGTSRLRAETAGVVACAQVQSVNQLKFGIK
jgi:16S rRNA (uracil1498-N3)-methyltransferase